MKRTKRLITLLVCLFTLASCDFLNRPTTTLTTSEPDSTSDTTNTSDTSTSSVHDGEPFWVHFKTYCLETLDSVFTNYIEQMPLVNNFDFHLSGWYLEATYNNIVSFPLIVTSEITLHAKWDILDINDFGFELTSDNEGYKVVSYGGNTNNLVMPNTYNGKPILEIGEYVFANNGVIQVLTLPVHLIRIRLAAFKNCTQLYALALPLTLTHLDTDAFSGCTSLEGIILSANLKVIGNNAFEGCKISAITLFSKVEEIRSRAFADCIYLDEVKLHPSTPPLRFNNSFESTKDTLVYKVPADYLEIYKQNEHWSAFKDQIVSY
ncbi:MAG: leucine-rich repeat domain-containing protein [Bacilli bacterium]|jgi:hypothetical protein|nr:leucine-rich repeat domain-containing protein [Erysipelotrichia bacterium]